VGSGLALIPLADNPQTFRRCAAAPAAARNNRVDFPQPVCV